MSPNPRYLRALLPLSPTIAPYHIQNPANVSYSWVSLIDLVRRSTIANPH
jgi:hypothetical protein